MNQPSEEQFQMNRASDKEAALEAQTSELRDTERLELREERLVPRKVMQELGEVVIRTEVEEVPGRLEVQAYREEVQVEHVPIGQPVSERQAPWDEEGILVVPIYEEQLVVSKRLILKEHLRIRRTALTEVQLFEDTLRRDRIAIEDPAGTGAVRELSPFDSDASPPSPPAEEAEKPGLVEKVVRKVIS